MPRRAETTEPERLSALIGDVYECALDPSRWDDTLTKFVATFSPPNWDVAMLVWEGLGKPGIRWVGTTGVVAHARQGYEMVFAGRNVWSQHVGMKPLGQVFDSDELVSRQAFLQSDLYQRFLKTWGIELALITLFERTSDEVLGLVVAGPPDQPIDGLSRGMRLIAPHIQRTVRISYGLAEAKLRAAGAEAMLNLGHVAVVALTQEMGTVSHNERAAELQAKGLLRFAHGKFSFSDPDAQHRLAALTLQTIPASDAFRIEDEAGNSFAVLAMTIKPQREGVLGGWVEGAGLLVSISTPHATPLMEAGRLRAWYDLTASEARLATMIADGKNLSEYAENRGVSVEAARFLLKGVFRKTGAESQAQLAALVNRLPQG
jgi:DNA-binding CsgD family transcriptional regulator